MALDAGDGMILGILAIIISIFALFASIASAFFAYQQYRISARTLGPSIHIQQYFIKDPETKRVHSQNVHVYNEGGPANNFDIDRRTFILIKNDVPNDLIPAEMLFPLFGYYFVTRRTGASVGLVYSVERAGNQIDFARLSREWMAFSGRNDKFKYTYPNVVNYLRISFVDRAGVSGERCFRETELIKCGEYREISESIPLHPSFNLESVTPEQIAREMLR